MDDQNTQNNTLPTDLNNPITDTTETAQMSPVTQDTPDDFPMLSPAQGPASTTPSPSIIQTPHPTYTPNDSISDDPIPAQTPSPLHDMTATQDPDLLAIKKNALQELSPLVGHLEQTPEEKFKTMLMMIQASDDKSMLGAAYDTAQQITDEKVKAQALLDIVNEINYFTRPTDN